MLKNTIQIVLHEKKYYKNEYFVFSEDICGPNDTFVSWSTKEFHSLLFMTFIIYNVSFLHFKN